MKKNKKIIGFICIIIGLLLPTASLTTILYKQSSQKSSYTEYKDLSESIDYKRLIEETKQYNKTSSNIPTVDPFINKDYDAKYKVNVKSSKGIYAYLIAPSIEAVLPIYLGATSNNLAKGAAHVDGTSLPDGINKGRAVIAAHYGRANGVYFLNIPRLKNKDKLYIDKGDEVLIYEVSSQEIIKEGDGQALLPKENDLDIETLTLLTCYPAPPWPERLLVNANRIKTDKRVVGDASKIDTLKYEDGTKIEESLISTNDSNKINSSVERFNLGIKIGTLIGWSLIILTAFKLVKYIKNK